MVFPCRGLSRGIVSYPPAWGCHSGSWSAIGGSENRQGIEEKSFPAGFGLSDVRVVLINTSADVFETMPYSGALDHLASQSREDPAEEDLDFGGEESVSRVLLDLVGDLAALSGGVSAWARRAVGPELTACSQSSPPTGPSPVADGAIG